MWLCSMTDYVPDKKLMNTPLLGNCVAGRAALGNFHLIQQWCYLQTIASQYMLRNFFKVIKLHHLFFTTVWCMTVKLQDVVQLPSVIASIKQEYWSFDVRVSVLNISNQSHILGIAYSHLCHETFPILTSISTQQCDLD